MSRLSKAYFNETRNVALSPFRIKTSQGERTFVSSHFSQRQPMGGGKQGKNIR